MALDVTYDDIMVVLQAKETGEIFRVKGMKTWMDYSRNGISDKLKVVCVVTGASTLRRIEDHAMTLRNEHWRVLQEVALWSIV